MEPEQETGKKTQEKEKAETVVIIEFSYGKVNF